MDEYIKALLEVIRIQTEVIDEQDGVIDKLKQIDRNNEKIKNNFKQIIIKKDEHIKILEEELHERSDH